MFYSRWESKDNIKKYLQKINYKDDCKASGLPLIYEDDSIYTTNGEGHSLVIGSIGSGKTQALVLPLMKLAMIAGESIILNDSKGDIYKRTAKEFKNRGYNVILLDFDNSVYGNYFNPLNLAFRLYKEGNQDKCVNILEETGYYLFADLKSNSDLFWENSVIDYFTGICLYLFEKNENEVNLRDVVELANKLSNNEECHKFLNEIGKSNIIYYNVSGTLNAPSDTKGSIIATFNQRIKKFINKKNLNSMMEKTDFDISTIPTKKTIVYIFSGYYDYCNSLIPLFINQVFEAVNIYKKEKKINIILDEFDNLLPIKNFAEIINYSRSVNINFTCVIQNFVNLINTYGKENSEIIKLCFSNIVYLYTNDLYTLEEISNLCGNETSSKALVSTEELKTFQKFDAIFLIPRIMPFKTKLVPDYKIDWGIDFQNIDFELRKKTDTL